MTFIVAFGLVKAVTNFFAGTLSDRFGRKPVLVTGWLFGLPVPLLLIWAPTWSWVIAANILLGINQGLTWSTTVIMKIDLAGPHRRGLAMGLNEAAGYLAVSVTALLTGFIAARAGLRPEPFYLGIAYAALGFALSGLGVRETRSHADHEAALSQSHNDPPLSDLSVREVIVRTSFAEPSLSAASQAGLVNNLNDGMAWGLLPLFFVSPDCRSAVSASSRRSTRRCGVSGNSSPGMVRPCRSQKVDRGRHVDPGSCHRRDRRNGNLRRVVDRHGPPRGRDRPGLPDPSRHRRGRG